MATARIDEEIDLCYEIEGSGPLVLFISGSGSDLRHKPSVFDGPLPQHCTVLAFDQRGLGRSSKPDRPSTMADYANDAAGLLKAVGWQQAGVIGVSFGGMVAQELAINHATLVERLVLCCTSSGGAGGSSYPLHELAELDDDERRRTSLAISDHRYDRDWQQANPDEADALLDFLRARDAAADVAADSVVGARRQLESRRHHDTWDHLGRISTPTLICAGRYDSIAPLENSEALAEGIDGAWLEVFDGGHLFLLQDRHAWSVIIDFLTGSDV